MFKCVQFQLEFISFYITTTLSKLIKKNWIPLTWDLIRHFDALARLFLDKSVHEERVIKTISTFNFPILRKWTILLPPPSISIKNICLLIEPNYYNWISFSSRRKLWDYAKRFRNFWRTLRLLLRSRTCSKPKLKVSVTNIWWKYVKIDFSDENYELSPFVNFFVMKLSCQYSIMNKIYRFFIYFILSIIVVEYSWLLFQSFSLRQKIRYFVYRYLHLYVSTILTNNKVVCKIKWQGMTMAVTVLTTRHRIIEESHKVKCLQWTLSWTSKSTRKVIGYRGLLQSVTLEICFVWVVAYTGAAYQVLDGTLLMTIISKWDCQFLTRLMYLVECVVITFCIFYVSIIPHICIYFATESQVQTLLLSEYVRKLAADSRKMLKCPNLNQKVHDSLRKILYRQLELKRYIQPLLDSYDQWRWDLYRLYLDNRSLITTVGLIYVIPGTMSFAFNLYEFAEVHITLRCELKTFNETFFLAWN